MFGIDCTTSPPVADLRAAGVTFVCRYLSEVNSLTQVKLLMLEEAKTLSQASIAIVSNYEWYANRALEGSASGVTDAQIAASQHAACGGPADKPIYFSVDFDATAIQIPAIIDYFKKGVASVIGLARTGAYGPYQVIKALFDAGAITWGWQTYAWSGGVWEPRAHIQQYQNGIMMAGISVDYNRSMKSDFGQWLQGGSVQTYTTQSGDFSAFFTATDADHWQCKQTGKIVQYGIKSFYSGLSADGNTLPIIGLPVTDEIYMTVSGQTVVLQVFERAGIWYDPSHVKDTQPGTGNCALCHLTDIDFLKSTPGLALPTQPPIDVTALIAGVKTLQAYNDAAATSLLKALGGN